MGAASELGRGVWEAPYLFEGVRVLIAIDRTGNVRKHVKLAPGIDRFRAGEWLWDLLEKLDPCPVRLVPDAPLTHAPREIDPRLYIDARSPLAKRRYIVGLAKEAARKAPPRLT